MALKDGLGWKDFLSTLKTFSRHSSPSLGAVAFQPSFGCQSAVIQLSIGCHSAVIQLSISSHSAAIQLSISCHSAVAGKCNLCAWVQTTRCQKSLCCVFLKVTVRVWVHSYEIHIKLPPLFIHVLFSLSDSASHRQPHSISVNQQLTFDCSPAVLGRLFFCHVPNSSTKNFFWKGKKCEKWLWWNESHTHLAHTNTLPKDTYKGRWLIIDTHSYTHTHTHTHIQEFKIPFYVWSISWLCQPDTAASSHRLTDFSLTENFRKISKLNFQECPTLLCFALAARPLHLANERPTLKTSI